jgi:hypothetical protein
MLRWENVDIETNGVQYSVQTPCVHLSGSEGG